MRVVPAVVHDQVAATLPEAARRRVRVALPLGPVAQWSEQTAHNRLVVGSIPTGPTSLWSPAPSKPLTCTSAVLSAQAIGLPRLWAGILPSSPW